MKKKILIILILIIFFLLTFSCQLISLIFDDSSRLDFGWTNFETDVCFENLVDQNYRIITSSYQFNDYLFISYINLNDNYIYFKVKNIQEKHLYENMFYPVNSYENQNENIKINSTFEFGNYDNHPLDYIPLFEKINDTIFNFYYLNSSFALNKITYKFIPNALQENFYFEQLDIKSSEVQTFLNPAKNAILYNLFKSNKIAYITSDTTTQKCYIIFWDKQELTFKLIELSGGTFDSFNYSTLVEYDTNQIFLAIIKDSDLYIYDFCNINDETIEPITIYNTNEDSKIPDTKSFKLIYIEEKDKLYLSWAYSKGGKKYLAISEVDRKNKLIIDRIKYEITGYDLLNIDVKQSVVAGIKTSNLNVVYSLYKNSDSSVIFTFGILNTNGFSDSNWSFSKAEQTDNVYEYPNIADSSNFFIDLNVLYEISQNYNYRHYLVLIN